MVEVPFYWLDIFTSNPFKGNPAAVCLMKTDLEDALYQNIAKELGLSETAFAEKIDENEYKLRWFTPEMEMPLCGHATIATAYTLTTENGVPSPIMFHTLSGEMKEVDENRVTLNFPFFSFNKTNDDRIMEAVGVEDYEEIRYTDNPPAYTAILREEKQVKELKPDFNRLRELCTELGVMGLIVTSPASLPYDYAYRTFAPGAGVDEDQGTGIVQCAIASYWKDRLGKNVMRSIQYSERVSEMDVEVIDEGVRITGSATPLIKGTILIKQNFTEQMFNFLVFG
jgi:PhzF family phenazine biosynthesis protein